MKRIYCRFDLTRGLFLWATLVTLFFFGLTYFNNRSFVASHQSIIQAHRSLLLSNDSLCYQRHQQLFDQLMAVDSTLTADKFLSILSQLDIDVRNQAEEQTLDDIRHLLELEFNKIQHEYDVLALWGGILTIVFLIFTFYSLSKSDEINKQSQLTARRIDNAQRQVERMTREIEDARVKVEKDEECIAQRIEESATDAATNATDKCNRQLNNINKDLEEIEARISQFPAIADKEYQSFDKLKETTLNDLHVQLEELNVKKVALTEFIETTQTTLVENFQSAISAKTGTLDKAVNNLLKQIEDLESRVDDMNYALDSITLPEESSNSPINEQQVIEEVKADQNNDVQHV